MRVALCTRNAGNPVVRLLAKLANDDGHAAHVLTDPRQIEQEPHAYDVGFWRPDSRSDAVAAFARQVPEILEGVGVPFVNSLASCDRAWSKYVSARLFVAAGLPVPHTVLAPQQWDETSPRLDGTVVVKPVHGKAARGVEVYTDPDAALRAAAAAGEPTVLQSAIAWTELVRAVTTADGVLRAYEQPNPSAGPSPAIATFDRHAAVPLAQVPFDVEALASQMLAAVGGDLMRADMLRDSEGCLWALEINSSFGFPHDDPVIHGEFLRQFAAAAARRRVSVE
jgi:glutathione synthase/RimK-type ligase-like ATP-grasp enzyme